MLAGPQQKEFRKEILQTMQVVGRRNKFCENIISVPLPLAFTKFKCAIRIYV
ncbi:nitrogen fixation protein NifR [Staphylococcus aureus]|nr:nitrogen fixation protein NifR [Staphylococcus aureus]